MKFLEYLKTKGGTKVRSRREFLKTASFLSAGAISCEKRARKEVPEKTLPRADVQMVETPVLNIGFEEHGNSHAEPIILLHGFPYDVRSWDGVVSPLADAGYRVLCPYLRGYGPTRFREEGSPRMAEQAAIGQDVMDFADALNLDTFSLAGFDWGNRAACITSILHPDRVRAQVAIGGYSVQNTVTPSPPATADVEARLWYQWYFNTARGRLGLEENRHGICKYLWDTWSPEWSYTDEVFSLTAPSFDNPDFVDVVIHSYRHRHRNAVGEMRFVELERELAERPRINVRAIVLRGAAGGFGKPSEDPSRDQGRFANLVNRRIVSGAGHDLPSQRPDTVIEALLELLS